MSNRILGILIIFGFILSGILFYMYFFVYYTGSITIKSDLEDYSVSLYNKKLLKTAKYNCVENTCNLLDISPFDYSLNITKPGYKDHRIEVSMGRNDKIDLEIVFDKLTILNEVENSDLELTVEEKIDFLRSKETLSKIEKVKKEDIEIKKILGNTDYLFIRLGDKKYLYSSLLNQKYLVGLNIDVNYVKLGADENEFLFVTDKGIFIYDKYSGKLEYFAYFKDFVYDNSAYIGIVYKTDTRRLTNLGLRGKTKNMIIYYNPNSKEKKILYETDLDIIKIYRAGENIMFESSDQKEYKLENY